MFYYLILLILDRLGFHHVLMAVGIWPLMMVTIGETWRGQAAITRDVEDGLYSKAAYIITKVYIDISIALNSFGFDHSVSDEYSFHVLFADALQHSFLWWSILSLHCPRISLGWPSQRRCRRANFFRRQPSRESFLPVYRYIY